MHRQIAYHEIYLKHKAMYPFPFSEYVVHHQDGDKQNNSIKNLIILTREEHNYVHGIREPSRADMELTNVRERYCEYTEIANNKIEKLRSDCEMKGRYINSMKEQLRISKLPATPIGVSVWISVFFIAMMFMTHDSKIGYRVFGYILAFANILIMNRIVTLQVR